MRFLALLPTSLSIVAFVVTMMCIFAGSKPGFMVDYAVLTLNTSHIRDNLSLVAPSGSPNAAASLFDDVTSSVRDEINDSVASLARHIGLHDFYSIHVLNICEGYYRSTNASSRVGSGDTEPKNVTRCSKDTFTSGFDLRETIGRELGTIPDRNIDSAKLRWPTGVDAGMRALNAVSRVMSVVYCVGLASIGVALLLSTLSIFFSGRLSACVNILVSSVAVLAVSIASILATAIGDKAAVLINEGGKQIGISAQKSTKFLSLTWIAPACMLAASFVWCLDCICGRRRGVSF